MRLERRLVALLLGLLLACAAACGRSSPGLSLVDLDGRPLDPFAGPAAATVFLFTRTDCPISNRYAPEVRRLHAAFSPRGVAFWLVYVDPDEPVEAIREHLADYRYPIPALRDPGHDLVKRTGARVTPEAAVFLPGEPGPRMVYRGRIDDRWVDFGKSRAAPDRRDLETVLSDVVGGRRVTPTTMPAVGCFIADLR
jgi:AhpC/TSA family